MRSGSSDCAYTTMAEKAEAITRPITTLSRMVAPSPTCGSSRVKGSTPRIEPQITFRRPIRSPSGPPTSVPTATAPRKTKR